MAEFSYTAEQQAAINSNASMVITACPGSGKTTVVVEKIRKEVADLANFQGVIGITFTVKASKELKQRCKRDGYDLKSSFFGTIDHFCLSEIIFPFISRFYGNSDKPIECKSLRDLHSPLLDKVPNCRENSTNVSSDKYDFLEDEFEILYAEGFVILEYLGVIANHILKNSKACRTYFGAKYQSVYVDEYQDSSEPQHKLFLELLNLGLTGVAVGDIQQSIYAWRGSKSEFISQLTAQPDVFEHHIVNINHRCHPSITNYSNRLFDKSCALTPTEEIRVYQWSYAGTQLDIAESLNSAIKDLIDKGLASSLSQIAILVRNNNTLDFLAQKLVIPFRIFDEDPLATRNTPVCNIFSGLLKFKFDKNFHANEIIEAIENYRSIPLKKITGFRKLIHAVQPLNREELATSIVDLAKELIDIEPSQSEIELINLICCDDKLLKHYKSIDEQEVQVMTLHKSKGLEFEVVYHLDLYDWIFPKREYIQGNFDEVFSDWQQDLNLHFVGITRAKDYCFLVTSTSRLNFQHQVKNGKPSQFLNMEGLKDLHHS
jgi:DNA helicase-2/ATP-dependent DNA helicase PcrA